MPSIQKPLVSNVQLTAAQVILYTVPANTSTTIQSAVATNTTAIPRTVQFNIVPSGGSVLPSTMIINTITVPANSQIALPWLILQTLLAGSTIQGASDLTSAVTIRISGVEVS